MEHGWISVDKFMPPMRVEKDRYEDGRDSLESDYVLVWDGTKVEIANAIFDGKDLFWMDRFAEVVEVTYWMPMPEAPGK